MKIIIKSINLDLSDEQKIEMEEKISKLDHFIDVFSQDQELKPPGEVEIIVSRETNHHLKGPIFKTAINLIVPGKTLRAEAQEESIDASFQKAKDEAEREIKKYKGKSRSKFKKGMIKLKRMLRRP